MLITFFINANRIIMQRMPESHVISMENLFYIRMTLYFFSEVSFNKVKKIISNLKNKRSRDVHGLNVKIIYSVKYLILLLQEKVK